MKTLEEVLVEITPAPDPEFVEEMEERMKLGFPSERKPRFSLPKLPSLSAKPLVAAAASALLALAVTVSVLSEGSDKGPSDQVAMEEVKPLAGEGGVPEKPEAVQLDSYVAPTSGTALPPDARVAAPVPPDGDVAPGRRDRKVERTAQLELAAEAKEFDKVADSIFAIAARHNGFVLSSSFTEGEGGLNTGAFDLRVPVTRLNQTLNELSRLATVRTRSESATDVTGRFVATRDKLQIARAERKSLLTRLENATTDQAAQAIRQRLEIVAGEINGLRSTLRSMRERTDYAAVSVQLVDKDSGAAATPSETDEAVDDAVGSLEDILNFLIRVLGVLVPLALAAGIGWFVATRARKRSRERALA